MPNKLTVPIRENFIYPKSLNNPSASQKPLMVKNYDK
jgi:hypothetical protein